MSVLHRGGGALVGGVFGAWFAGLKLAGETIHPLVTRLYQMAPPQFVLIAGVVVFAVAGFKLARYLSLAGVVIAFGVFFLVEFVLPVGSYDVLNAMYLVYVLVPLLLFLSSIRVLLPTSFIPVIR